MCYAVVLSTDSDTDLSKYDCKEVKFCKEADDIPESKLLKYKRPLHNYVAKEKIEKNYQIELKIERNSRLLQRFLTKSW